MSASSRGSTAERRYKALREREGWVVYRAAGSKGGADLICMDKTKVVLTQVKANKGSPWMNFRQVERASLRAEAAMIHATAELVHWPPGGEMRVYLPDEWP